MATLSLFALPGEHSKKVTISNPGSGPSQRTKCAGTMILLDFQATRTVRNKCLLFEPIKMFVSFCSTIVIDVIIHGNKLFGALSYNECIEYFIPKYSLCSFAVNSSFTCWPQASIDLLYGPINCFSLWKNFI